MSTVTLRPNASVSSSSSVSVTGGGGTLHGATSDNSDASYVAVPRNESFRVDFGTTVLPAGSILRTITPRMRLLQATGFSLATMDVFTVVDGREDYPLATLSEYRSDAGTIITVTGPSATADDLTQALVDSLRVAVETAMEETLVHELYLDLVITTIPTVAVDAVTPDPVTATARPTVSWVYTPGSDGGPQTRYQVRVFTAAQYGAGGFDPTTSVAYDGPVPRDEYGSATSHQLPALETGITYRAYVRTAQTINGQPHWSEWDYDQFATSFTGPTFDSFTATADDTNGRIVLEVERDTGGTAWEELTVERSADAGATWEFVRGATDVDVSAGDTWSGYDYEAGNGEPMLYRARATSTEFVGTWETTPAVSWESDVSWLKNPADPNQNLAVIVSSAPRLRRQRRQGIHRVTGRAAPVVTSDVRQLATGPLVLATIDDADADALDELLDVAVLLLHTPSGDRFGSKYIAVGDTDEDRLADYHGSPERLWSVPFVEIDRPLDAGIAEVT